MDKVAYTKVHSSFRQVDVSLQTVTTTTDLNYSYMSDVPLKRVSPTEQLIDQAKSNLKRERDDDDEYGSTYSSLSSHRPQKPKKKKKNKKTVSKSSAYK